MWAEAVGYFEAHRATLARGGISLRARLEPDEGILCSYSGGVVRLALPDPALPGGALRATMIAALMGIEVDEVAWLFGTQLSRLVAHEIGHALRDEAGRMSDDPWSEEQAAERLACLLSRPHLDAAARAGMRALLHRPAWSLGGMAEAIASHRLADRARALPVMSGLEPVSPPPRHLYRDLSTFLRVSVAWAYLDLLLDPEDDLDAYRNELLLAA